MMPENITENTSSAQRLLNLGGLAFGAYYATDESPRDSFAGAKWIELFWGNIAF